jgi:N-acyl-D-aspartate/D-glutamate deacylase
VTFREGEMTGALPGVVVRGPQSVMMAEAAE